MGTSDGEWSERDELILRAAARVRRGLHRDPFSGLLVFRGDRFAEAIDVTLTEFVPAGVPLSVVVADLDHFKRINDTHGHALGDEVLAATGAALRDLVRPLDMVLARGGDSYLLVLLGAGLEVAQSRAEQARDLLTQVTVRGAPLDLTASFGVATHDGTETAAALVERVFAAQYRAKGFGRNRVEVADDA
ncbi:MAG TPA: GGDEF domain-containing protein [Acidimicrobiales bacterium]